MENDKLSTAEEADIINEVPEEEDTASEENPPAIKGDDDYTISDEDSSQSVEDNEADRRHRKSNTIWNNAVHPRTLMRPRNLPSNHSRMFYSFYGCTQTKREVIIDKIG